MGGTERVAPWRQGFGVLYKNYAISGGRDARLRTEERKNEGLTPCVWAFMPERGGENNRCLRPTPCLPNSGSSAGSVCSRKYRPRNTARGSPLFNRGEMGGVTSCNCLPPISLFAVSCRIATCPEFTRHCAVCKMPRRRCSWKSASPGVRSRTRSPITVMRMASGNFPPSQYHPRCPPSLPPACRRRPPHLLRHRPRHIAHRRCHLQPLPRHLTHRRCPQPPPRPCVHRRRPRHPTRMHRRRPLPSPPTCRRRLLSSRHCAHLRRPQMFPRHFIHRRCRLPLPRHLTHRRCRQPPPRDCVHRSCPPTLPRPPPTHRRHPLQCRRRLIRRRAPPSLPRHPTRRSSRALPLHSAHRHRNRQAMTGTLTRGAPAG